MEMTSKRKRAGMQFALTAIAATVASSFYISPSFAQEQQSPATEAVPAPAATSDTSATDSSEAPVATIVVTGSRLKRVDTETASPIVTIDRAQIESRGVATVGDLLQELPSIAGAATNTQVNNGGGDGAATVSLRGLGDERTLVLLDGRRLGPSFDVNSIPINMIERVDVLKEGAGAVYGSDAVGGVVNFITRKDFTGVDVAYQYGQSSKHDGYQNSVELTLGTASEKGHAMLGLNYNKQDKIGAADRDFSKNALYWYKAYGQVNVITLGSSRTPQGRIYLPAGVATANGYLDGDGAPCGSVSRNAGAAGTVAADYHCYTGADAFDYQPYNLISTPQERGGLFGSAAYNITDSVEAYADVLHSFTQSGFDIAPLPVDANADDVIISANSVYNPFGVDFGGGGNQFLTRTNVLGDRKSQVETTLDQISGGLRGGIGQTTWSWDLGLTYQRFAQNNSVTGYLLGSKLQQAIGPSFLAADGTPTCGTLASPIAGCTPVDIFNLDDPAQADALASITSGYENRQVQTTRIAELAFSGDVLTWAPGTIKAAVGAAYHEEFLNDNVDDLVVAAPPNYLNCQLAQETCSGDTSGSDKVKELYAELFVPLLAQQPFAYSLNLTLGTRFSKYDSFGDTTNSTVKLEYRPIRDLLLRGTYAEVFRAPTIFDRFSAPASTADLFADPCKALTAADVTAHPELHYDRACQNVATDGSFDPENNQISGVLLSTPDLKAESGDVYTLGFVFDPNWLKGFSISADYWHYKINDAITTLGSNVVANTCLTSGQDQFCDLIQRRSTGQIYYIDLPTSNAGYFETDGVDIGVKYTMPKTPIGRFQTNLDVTYTHKFNYDLGDGETHNAVGTLDATFGNYARWRATAGLNWSLGDFAAQWNTRFIDGTSIPASLNNNFLSDVYTESTIVTQGAVFYHDVALMYSAPFGTKFTAGMQNVFDKQPPLAYGFTLNANVDVNTYDAIGRYIYFRVEQSF